MRGESKSLADFVAEAHRRCARPGRRESLEFNWWDEHAVPLDDLLAETREMADGVVTAAFGGDFFLAVDRAWDLVEVGAGTGGALWYSLWEVCKLAEQVDSFLATLDHYGPTAALARGCRHDFLALLMLADCCDENGRPGAAAEARYLFARLREIDS